jgi:hypothetical protein
LQKTSAEFFVSFYPPLPSEIFHKVKWPHQWVRTVLELIQFTSHAWRQWLKNPSQKRAGGVALSSKPSTAKINK